MEQTQTTNTLPAIAQQQTQAPAQIPATSIFSEMAAFENAQRVAKMLAASTLVPQQFQNNVPNVMIALEMANRLNASPFMVMQNMYVVHGRPGFSATYVIASINACGRFSPLRFEITGEGDNRSCYAWVTEKSTGERLEGSPISIKMAKAEGWYSKQGSKWQTMPDQMLRYRAAAFFGRLYAPDILMGMQTAEEAEDIGPAAPAYRPAAQEAVLVEATVVETTAEPLSGVDAINAMLAAAPQTAEATAAPEPAPEQPSAPPADEEPPHPAETAEAAPAPEAEQPGEPEAHRAMLRYIQELDDKAGMSELRGWADRHRQKLRKELGGEQSEFFQAVVEHWQGLVAELPQ